MKKKKVQGERRLQREEKGEEEAEEKEKRSQNVPTHKLFIYFKGALGIEGYSLR